LIFVLVSEALFRKAIEQAAQSEERDFLFLDDEEALMTALKKETADAFFLEIGSSIPDGVEVIQKLNRTPATQKIPIVAFGNSLRADLLQDAREAGADLVLPKAAFREKLPELMRHYSKTSGKGSGGGRK